MMDNWQFFLQKEGDYAWLPLETPQVEILEGRYQLIAHTQTADSAVRVSIRHQYEQDNIPQENIQESVRQANLAGKVDILPLVYLGLGSWFVSCQPVVGHEAEVSGAGHHLEIQVLPQDFDLFEDWSFGADDPASEAMVQPSFLPEEISLADLTVDTAIAESPAAASQNPALQGETVLDSTLEGRAPIAPDNLRLPTFSADTPMVEFRTVSPKELPRLVSDHVVLDVDGTPQLPTFARSKVMFTTKQEQRSRALAKIQFIAAVVGQHEPQRELPARQEKFQSMLARLAVGTRQQ